MGTRGYYVFKYKGKYYVFYNQFDSYPDGEHGLGYRIVEELKHLTVEEMREYLNNFIERNTKYSQSNDEGERSIHFKSLKCALENPFNFDFNIEQFEPNNDLWIEYIYIINLDQELIEMKQYNKKISFRLDKIPDNWCETFINETNEDNYYNVHIEALDGKK
jgi:hypothetical protein